MSHFCEDRVCIVTGAARGIGREYALMLAAHGAKVVVNDLGGARDGTGSDLTPAQQVVDEIKAAGGEAIVNGADVSDYAASGEMIQQAIDTWGRLDVLISNAGILRDRMLVNMEEAEWDAVIKVHLKGTFAPARHAAAYWRLATDWASLLASFRPAHRDVTDPMADGRCLLCHVTAAQDPDALLAAGYRLQEGVGCEACHGPGSRYMYPEVMADREQFLARGGIVPDEETCRRCHRNAERFDFASWWPKIAHKKEAGAEGGGTHEEED